MDTPTADLIRSWAPPAFVWADYGFPDGPDPDPLDARIGWAAGTLFAVTGRTLASITTPEEASIAQKVLSVFTIMEAVGGGKAALAVLEKPWLKSFTAGSYREDRFSPAEMAGGSTQAPPYPPVLWALLWALMTDEKRDEWMFKLTGRHAPAGVFIQPDWGGPRHHFGEGLLSGPGYMHGPFGGW